VHLRAQASRAGRGTDAGASAREAAGTYARVRFDVERIGRPIGERDLLIASIALARNLTVVTHNLGEFTRVPALKTEDWH
jgi:tRNA(fMet)-specific endonuclease VapC